MESMDSKSGAVSLGAWEEMLRSARTGRALHRLTVIEPWIERQQIEITTIAAPTGFEGLRAEWFLKECQAWGLHAAIDEAGNVVAERPGRAATAPALALTAHLDTAFPPGTPVEPQRRRGRILAPGICDNGAGLAALLGLMRVMHETGVETARPVLFVANVGEEGEGDLKGMRHLFRPRGTYARRIGATVVLDGPGCEPVTIEALPSRRLKLVFEGPGGHSWSDLGRASAIHAAARTATALLAQVQPQAGELGCNLGWMQGGSAVNAIAASASLKIDLRARRSAALDGLEHAVRRALALGLEQENAAALSGTVHGRIEPLGERPGGELAADAPLLQLVQRVDAHLRIATHLQCASTDANIPISQGRQALRLGAGGSGGAIHTPKEWYDPTGRTRALERVLLITLAWAGAWTGARAGGATSSPPPARLP